MSTREVGSSHAADPLEGGRTDSANLSRPVRTLLTKHEAAKLLGVSVRSFERYVMHGLPRVRIGGSLRYDEEDLKRWVARHKDGSFESVAMASTPSASATMDDGLNCRRAAEILAELER